ncbi:hypothetical protein QYE76_052561 [Lolium multiflorum]|uniref:Uncharacterized protein n=1 Tax=Lolium multiflorum TaxID=4521 RepID=A0AAD8WJ12_LOLMU|nr:hypothetical protein QYE76_052561 [Lolium multiflorum]
MIIAAKLGILWNGTKSPHPKSLPRFFTRVMCRQKDDSVGQLLKKLATAHVPNKDSERASDADIGRKEAGFGPIVLASNHLSGRLGSAHLDPPELNIKEKQVTAHVPAKQHCSTDVQSSSDANVCRNKTEGCGTGEAKIRRLQKDLDVATWRNKEMNRGWNSTIQDGLHAVADLQKLVAGNLVTALADADVHEINWTILEQLRFEFDEDQEEVKHVLNSLFSDCLRQYRSRLKKKYFTGKITGSVPTISPFKQMTDKQWGDLVKHWSDPKNMNLAKQNQENRGKLLLPSHRTSQEFELEDPDNDSLLDAVSFLEFHGTEAREGMDEARAGLSKLFPYFFPKKEEPATFLGLAKCFNPPEDLGLKMRHENMKVAVESTVALVADSQQTIDWAKVGDTEQIEQTKWRSLIKAAKLNTKKILAYLGIKPSSTPSSSKPEV